MTYFTRIDNPLLERQLKILLLIIRFSVGYQKSYAALRRRDFAYAGVSPYCVSQELAKLVKLKVIRWDHERDMVWLNPDLSQWGVDRAGENPGDNLRRMFRIAARNSLKWQWAVCRSVNLKVAETATPSNKDNKEKEEKSNKR